MQLRELKPDGRNPRKISQKQKTILANTLAKFGDLSGVVFNRRSQTLVGGHQRLKVLPSDAEIQIERTYDRPTEAGTVAEGHILVNGERYVYREVDVDVPTQMAMNVAANKAGGEFDMHLLPDFLIDLDSHNFDMELTGFTKEELDELLGGGQDDPYGGGGDAGSLARTFVVPPFSVLDARQGYWRTRKEMWLKQIGDNGESREGTLGDKEGMIGGINNGVSILDPVLAEAMLHWFNLPGGFALDPFAGDTVFGYVAKRLGYNFQGIELRKVQADLNQERCDSITLEEHPDSGQAIYYNDTSENIDKYFADGTADFLFSCPPYFDLEVYSDDPKDLSNQGTYEQFANLIEGILRKAVRKLKPNRFACVVFTELRDKTGAYRGSVPDMIRIMREAGMEYYNELMLISPAGSAQLRARKSMGNRKVVRLHQNVLVFYKGDIKAIKTEFPKLEVSELANSEAAEK